MNVLPAHKHYVCSLESLQCSLANFLQVKSTCYTYYSVTMSCCADAFASLRSDFFGRPQEHSWMFVITAYLLTWGCVVIVIWLLLNYVIAAIFREYINLRDEFVHAKAEFYWHASHLTVRSFQHALAVITLDVCSTPIRASIEFFFYRHVLYFITRD